MIIDLYKLFKQFKNSNKLPLEDFNTETFAGILNLYPDIKEVLIKNLWKLPEDNYRITTQLKKSLENDFNCIIDLVVEGDNNICFIENKVNSHEGLRQLERYSLVLQKYYPNKKHYLYYCTKNSDPKNEDGKYDQFNFKQFRWYEVAKKLKPLASKKPLVRNYLNFLYQHQMAQDNTIRIENLLAIRNLSKSLEMIEFYVENSIDDFSKLFKPSLRSKSRLVDQLKQHNRICVYTEKPLLDSLGGWSEILYGINLDELILFTQFFVSINHQQYSEFYNEGKKQEIFDFEESEYGIALKISQDLGLYLNNENADNDIKIWFNKSFLKCNDFIQSTSLSWNTLK